MSGHQGAEGYTTIPFYLDVLHICAVSFWIGGIFFLRSNYSFFLKKSGVGLWEIYKSLINRFSRLATGCVLVAGITGLALSFFNVTGFSVLLHSEYGAVLLLKAVLVGVIAALGGINKFIVIPQINTTDKEDWLDLQNIRKKLFFMVNAEMALGIAVLLLTSLLTHVSPVV
jgi:putative copper export protein